MKMREQTKGAPLQYDLEDQNSCVPVWCHSSRNSRKEHLGYIDQYESVLSKRSAGRREQGSGSRSQLPVGAEASVRAQAGVPKPRAPAEVQTPGSGERQRSRGIPSAPLSGTQRSMSRTTEVLPKFWQISNVRSVTDSKHARPSQNRDMMEIMMFQASFCQDCDDLA